ncbi:hypothetical protein FRC07_009336 [Ceratobasidium sp. 392]|nr:hypothetical protein FRC07_009336 [Ceratobasidium sp. 392]
MHAEIGIALPPAGPNVGKIRVTLVIEMMKEFDGYYLMDAFNGDEDKFMSTHTAVFPAGREAREKYSWTYEIPYASEVWKRVLNGAARGGGGYSRIKHVDLTGEQAKHDAISVDVVVNGEPGDDDESSVDREVLKDEDEGATTRSRVDPTSD